MRVPPIDRNKVLDAIDLFSVKGSEKPNSDKTTMQVGSGFDSSVNITISEEGKRILSEDRENLSKYGINTTRFEVIEFGDINDEAGKERVRRELSKQRLSEVYGKQYNKQDYQRKPGIFI